jgi:hypothetical protein
LLVEDLVLRLSEPHAPKTVFHPDAEETEVRIDRLFRIAAVVGVVAVDAVHTPVAQFAAAAEGAIHTIFAVKDAMVVIAIFRFIARKGHVAVATFFGVLTVRAVFVLHALQAHMGRALPELVELVKDCHNQSL